MQSDKRQFPLQKAVPKFANQMGNNAMHASAAPAFGAVLPPCANPFPFHGVEFQPSEVCPKNYIIFDQTDKRSQIMFHPATAHKFSGPGLNNCPPYFKNHFAMEDVNYVESEISCSLKEDSDDIDMLLSLEEDEEEDYDDEEVSTARTYGNYGDNSFSDTCSSYDAKPKKNKSYTSTNNKSSGSGSRCNSERKRQKMKKMMDVLRRIVPGSEHMNSAAVLDEAVTYLKSLKVEVQKIGAGNFNPED